MTQPIIPKPRPWTDADLCKWEARLGFSTSLAATLLGLTPRAYRRLKAGDKLQGLHKSRV